MQGYVPCLLSPYDPPTRHRHPMHLPSPFTSRAETHYPPGHPFFIRSRSPTPTPLSSLTPQDTPSPVPTPHKGVKPMKRMRIRVPPICTSFTTSREPRQLTKLRHCVTLLGTPYTHR